MSRILIRAVKVGLAVTIAFGIAALTSSGLRAILLDGYLLTVGGVLLLALVRATRAHAPAAEGSEFDRAVAAMRRRPPDSGELTLLRDLELSSLNSFHLHVRLRPLLREIAAHRLRTRYGVDLEAEPVRAREFVGPSAWELVRPDRPPPPDRLAAGPATSELREIVTELEEV